MRQRAHSRPPLRSDKGFVLIVAVITIATVLTVVVLATSLAAIDRLQTTNIAINGLRTRTLADGCLQEGLVQLARNPAAGAWSGALGDGTCTTSIAGSGGTRTVTGTIVRGQSTYAVSAVVTLSPFTLVSWDNEDI